MKNRKWKQGKGSGENSIRRTIQREEYIGRFKGKSIEACKRFVVNEIMQQREQNIEINQFIRETIVNQKRNISYL